MISLLHAIIPSHWLPVLAIGRREKWTITEVTCVAFITVLAHVLSTVLIGLLLSWIGWQLSERVDTFTHVVAPVILIVLGLVFVYRHYRHHHFHLHGGEAKARTIPSNLQEEAGYNDQVYLRLAETYLLKAEAQFKLGNSAGAAQTINLVRRRAHASEIAATDVNIDFILDERSRELITEEHRLTHCFGPENG